MADFYADTLTTTGTDCWLPWNATYTLTASSATATTITINATATNATTWAVWNVEAWEPVAEEPNVVERRRDAEQRADALLRSFLTPEQEQSWDRDKRFDLTVEGGNRPARHYRIERGTHGNIKRLENGRVVESLCVQPSSVPIPDANLAQMLHLLHDEEGLRRKAGIQRVA